MWSSWLNKGLNKKTNTSCCSANIFASFFLIFNAHNGTKGWWCSAGLIEPECVFCILTVIVLPWLWVRYVSALNFTAFSVHFWHSWSTTIQMLSSAPLSSTETQELLQNQSLRSSFPRRAAPLRLSSIFIAAWGCRARVPVPPARRCCLSCSAKPLCGPGSVNSADAAAPTELSLTRQEPGVPFRGSFQPSHGASNNYFQLSWSCCSKEQNSSLPFLTESFNSNPSSFISTN